MSSIDQTAKPALPAAATAANSAAPAALSAAGKSAKSAPMDDAKLHKVAKQFESVFLSEMLRLARPQDKASGFQAGQSGGTWQVFMDQAMGEAASARGGTGLARQIEDSLRRAQGKGAHS